MTTIIEFGSRNSGLFDAYSDKDAYLLYGFGDKVEDEVKSLERLGYSVTVASTDRAEYLSKEGSLFIRHVFFEGKFLSGDVVKVGEIKSLWSYSSNYEDEIQENSDMLRLLEYIPCTKSSISTINDIVVCSIRNVLIRKLAMQGFFSFSWQDVLSDSEKLGMLNKDESDFILRSRKLKNLYRSGVRMKLSSGYLNSLGYLVRKVIDDKRLFRIGRHKDILSLPEKEKDCSYSQLRAIELLCAYYDFDASMEKYSALSKKPSYFISRGFK